MAKNSKYESLTKELLGKIGGSANVSHFTHCVTRLRFNIKDKSKVEEGSIANLPGVLGTQWAADQFQVVIGPSVNEVFNMILDKTDLGERFASEETADENDAKKFSFSSILEVISGAFTPLIPAIIGAGMIKALVLILGNFDLINAESGAYATLSAAGNSVFYFLPIFIGYTASVKLKANGFIGAAIGATLLEPNFTNLVNAEGKFDFFNIPMYPVDYASTIIPIFCAVALYAILYKWLNRIVHENLKSVFVPTISMLIIIPLTVLVFGPFGVFTGEKMTEFFTWLGATNSILLGAFYGGYLVIGVIFGLQWAVVPVMIQNLANGGDMLMPAGCATNFAMFGLAFGIYLKSKDKDLKNIALGTTITGLLAGISEPIVYGLILRYKRTIPMVIGTGIVGGAIMGAFKVISVSFAFGNIFTVGAFTPFVPYIIGIVLSFALACGLVLVFGFEDSGEKA